MFMDRPSVENDLYTQLLSGKHESLIAFRKKDGCEVKDCFAVSQKDLDRKEVIRYLPVYMLERSGMGFQCPEKSCEAKRQTHIPRPARERTINTDMHGDDTGHFFVRGMSSVA